MEKETEFIKHLREEKLHAQDARNQLTLQKLAFATTLLGLSSVNLLEMNLDLNVLVYFVPWVAIVFDFYIMAEDYSVKRIGSFLKARSTETLEQDWEECVGKHRDPFAPWAMVCLTSLLWAGSVYLAWRGSSGMNPFLAGWAVVSLVTAWASFFWNRRLQRQALTMAARSQ